MKHAIELLPKYNIYVKGVHNCYLIVVDLSVYTMSQPFTYVRLKKARLAVSYAITFVLSAKGL